MLTTYSRDSTIFIYFLKLDTFIHKMYIINLSPLHQTLNEQLLVVLLQVH